MVSKTIALTTWLYPNIQTALFIQPTAIGTVYEDLGGVHGGFKFMRYQPHIRCNIAYTPWPSAYCPPHVPLVTSATLHLLSVLLSHFQPNTDTGHLVLFEDCGSILLAANPEDSNWFLITSRLNPTYDSWLVHI